MSDLLSQDPVWTSPKRLFDTTQMGIAVCINESCTVMAVRYRFFFFLLPSSIHSPPQINENCWFLQLFYIFHKHRLVPKSCPHLRFDFSFSVCKRIGKSCLRSLSRPRKLVPRDLSRSRCWNLSRLARPEAALLLFHALGARFRGCPTTLHL